MKDKTRTWITRLITFLTASAVLATTQPFFQEGIGKSLVIPLAVWVWVLLIISFLAVSVIALAAFAVLWVSDDLKSSEDQEKFEKAYNNLKELKPKLYLSVPFTAYWIFALAAAGWNITLGFYVFCSIFMYGAIFGLLSAMTSAIDSMKEEAA